MALLSDVDWVILLSVAVFFVLGKEGATVVRQIGRLYGRLSKLKSEMLGELSKAAEIPAPVPGQPVSIRAALLNWDSPTSHASGIPAAVASAPIAVVARVEPPIVFYSSMGLGPSTWATSQPAESPVSGGGR